MAKYNDPPKKNALAKAAEYKPSSSFIQAVKKSSFKKLPLSMSKGFGSKVEGGTGGRPDTPLPATGWKVTSFDATSGSSKADRLYDRAHGFMSRVWNKRMSLSREQLATKKHQDKYQRKLEKYDRIDARAYNEEMKEKLRKLGKGG